MLTIDKYMYIQHTGVEPRIKSMVRAGASLYKISLFYSKPSSNLTYTYLHSRGGSEGASFRSGNK